MTSLLSYPSSTQVHRTAGQRLGLRSFQEKQVRNFFERKTIAFRDFGFRQSSGKRIRNHKKQTTLQASPVSTSPPVPDTAVTWRSKNQQIRAQTALAELFAASKMGLDPSLNRFHAPLVYHDGYSCPWPETHTFPMQKFERTSHALLTTTSKTVASSNLPRPLVRSEVDYFRPPNFSEINIDEWLDLLNRDTEDGCQYDHSKAKLYCDFGRRFLERQLTREEVRIIGFREETHRPELVERTVLEVAGTVLTAQLALKYGIAANLAGGTHHAHPTGGAGYTILNDLAITANLLTMASPTGNHESDAETNANVTRAPGKHHSQTVERILVIDCDVHQGDGTAQYSTLWQDDGRLFTLSLHCESNYPFQKHNSTYDVGLPDRCNDHDYLIALEESVNRALSEVHPDLVIYDAGVDVFKNDKLGRLHLTEEGIRRRDRWVLDRCISMGIPVAAVVGGGYDKDIDALGRRHAIIHEECAYIWRKYKLWRSQL